MMVQVINWILWLQSSLRHGFSRHAAREAWRKPTHNVSNPGGFLSLVSWWCGYVCAVFICVHLRHLQIHIENSPLYWFVHRSRDP